MIAETGNRHDTALMLSAKTMDWHFLPSQLFQRQLVPPMVWPGVAMAVIAIGPGEGFAVASHAIDLGPVKGTMMSCAGSSRPTLPVSSPEIASARAIRVAPVAALIAAMPPTWSICS